MLKITETLENEKTVRLKLDGTVSVDTFNELKHVLSIHRDSMERIMILDMLGVDFMTEQPARQLAALRSARLQIINCSPFVEMLLGNISVEKGN